MSWLSERLKVALNKLAVKKHWIFLPGICAASIALELYCRSCSFILTSDSDQYLSAAKSFSEQSKFLSPDGTYYSWWQPLFPIILSVTPEPLVLLSWLNVACKIVLTFLLFDIADVLLQKRFQKVTFVLLSLCSVATMMISVFVWSDFLFMTLAYANLYFALNLGKKYSFACLLLTGFLLCIQRNAGLFWISGTCLWLLFDKGISFQKKTIRVAAIFLITTSGLWAWNIYNTYFLTAHFSFHGHPFFMDWWYNWRVIGETFSKIIVPVKNPLISILGVVIIAIILWKKFDRNISLVGCLLAMYTIGYACMVKLDHYEMERYFAPVFPLTFLLILRATECVSEVTRRARYGVIIVVCGWLLYPAVRTIKNVQFWRERSCIESRSKSY